MSELGDEFREMKKDKQEASARRLREALNNKHRIQNWCAANNFELRILNDSYHWQIRTPSGICNWYPSTGKLGMPESRPSGRYNTDAMMRIVLAFQTVRRDETND